MDNFFKTIYFNQVKQECEFCLAAVERMNKILVDEKAEDDFFREALDLVHHAAAISRIFWPPRCRDKKKTNRAHQRGQALRDELKIQSNHPVQNRTLRDHFEHYEHYEHYDERLDDWVENSKDKNIVNKLIGSRGSIGGIDDSDIIHHYDPSTKIYAFRGEHFNVQELVTGITDIYEKSCFFLEKSA